jgi:hypothetical protein
MKRCFAFYRLSFIVLLYCPSFFFSCRTQDVYHEQKSIVAKMISAMAHNDSLTLKSIMDSNNYIQDSFNYNFQFKKAHFQLGKGKNGNRDFEVIQYPKTDYLLCEIKTELNKGSVLSVQFLRVAPHKVFNFTVTGEASPEQWKM